MSEIKRGHEIALDFLANPAQDPALNAILHSTHTPSFANLNTFDSHAVRLDENNRAKVAQILGLEGYETRRFDFTSGAFLELFTLCAKQQVSITLASSLHQQSFYAGKLLSSHFSESSLPSSLPHTSFSSTSFSSSAFSSSAFSSAPLSWLHPDLREGIITPQSLQALLQAPHKCAGGMILLPFFNHDLLSRNPIDELLEVLSALPNALIILDISLLLQLWRARLLSLPALPRGANIAYICNGESLALARPSGFMLLPKSLGEPFSEIFEVLQSLSLPRPSLFEALIAALESESRPDSRLDSRQDSHQKPRPDSEPDSKHAFFAALQGHLGENLSLFAPLKHTAPNALPLRLSSIKARMLLQSLQIDHIRALNGLDCLYGNAKPSFVLQSMGYTELQSRECLSISYKSLESTQILDITQRIAQHYKQLRSLGL